MTHLTIAIDGPAGSGKGTLARRLAGHFGYAYLDTGLLYRGVGLKVLRQGGSLADPADAIAAAAALAPEDLSDESQLRNDDVAVAASRVAVIPEVRQVLLAYQRGFAASPPDGAAGAVLDGRDIGTVVCPDADVKFFVTASLEVRAARRVAELRERGLSVMPEAVFQDMQERDARDRERAVAPMVPAQGAIIIDTSGLDPDAVFSLALLALPEHRDLE